LPPQAAHADVYGMCLPRCSNDSRYRCKAPTGGSIWTLHNRSSGRSWLPPRWSASRSPSRLRPLPRSSGPRSNAPPASRTRFGGEIAKLERRILEAEILARGEQRDLRGFFVADMRVERSHQHKRVVEVLPDPLDVRLDAARATLVE